MSSDVIIVDNDDLKQLSAQKNTDVILLDDYKIDDDVMIHDNIVYDNRNNKTNLYDILVKENKLFVDIIDRCLEVENSPSMRRIVNKTLLNAYQRASKEYLRSDTFNKVLLRTLALLETEPDKKFQHIKYFYEALILQKFRKKRAQLLTLEKNLKKKSSTKRKYKQKNKEIGNKRPRQELIEIYDIASDSDTEVIDLGEDQNDVIVLDEIANVGNNGKENMKDNITSQSPYKGPLEQPLLAPQKEVNYHEPVFQNKTVRIQEIEAKIKELKERIQVLEEMEVTLDYDGSPYLVCDRLKKEVVELYKELCVINGEQAFKKLKVRLDVTEGHPSGPTKVLEDFLNDKEEQQPQFPDFTDVVSCVIQGLRLDGLFWTNAQIYREANALFIQCGRALQKRRQKREWKDLMSQVKIEQMDDEDPADKDPVLMARLEENRRTACRKEKEILEWYSALESKSADNPIRMQTTTSSEFLSIDEDDSDDSENEADDVISNSHISNTNMEINNSITQNQNIPNTQDLNTAIIENYSKLNNEINTECSINVNNIEENNTELQNIQSDKEITHEKLSTNEVYPIATGGSNTTIVTEMTTEESKQRNVNSNLDKNDKSFEPVKDTQTLSDNDNNIVTSSNDNDIYKATIEYTSSVKTEINDNEITEASKSNDMQVKSKADIKKENAIEVENLLDSLGSDYKVSVFDIEDPFLVIDISSDSSDDESCYVSDDNS